MHAGNRPLPVSNGHPSCRLLSTDMVVVILLALPLAGLALLLIRPELDHRWQHNPAHFWLVVGVAVVAVLVGLVMGEAARKRRDLRVFLVSLAFTTSAGFLALHALATPGVLLDGPNAGFDIATTVGLFVASLFAAVSGMSLRPSHSRAFARSQQGLRAGVIGLLVAWAVVSLAGLPPLDDPTLVEEGAGWLVVIGVLGMALYGLAALRYLGIYRRRRAPLVLAVVVTWVLLGEAMLAVTVSRNWHLSWWGWHLLMATAFVVTAMAVRNQYRSQDSVPATFSSLYLESTLGRVDRERADAVRALVALDEDSEAGGLAARFDLSGDEIEVLAHAAREIRRLDALFAPYLSGQLASRLRDNPQLTRLGGETREVSVLFADLVGFTAYSEKADPREVVSMLNECWARTLPLVEEHGGFVDSIAGDAVVVVFNVSGDHGDHALSACRAGLGFEKASRESLAKLPGRPTFRVGINTGPAVVGNIGTEGRRSFTAIGDTVNVAARLQTAAEPGEVLIGDSTRVQAGDRVVVEPVGTPELKGKSRPVEVYRLLEVRP
jgi:adenylate cyclase